MPVEDISDLNNQSGEELERISTAVPLDVGLKPAVSEKILDEGVEKIMIDFTEAASEIDDDKLRTLATNFGEHFRREVADASEKGDGRRLDKYRYVAVFLLLLPTEQDRIIAAAGSLARSEVKMLPGVHDFLNVLSIARGYKFLSTRDN